MLPNRVSNQRYTKANLVILSFDFAFDYKNINKQD